MNGAVIKADVIKVEMKRPLLWAFGFLIAGIVIGRTPAFLVLSPVLLFGLSLGLGLIFCGFLYRVYNYKPVFAFVLFLLVGLVRVGSSMHSHVTEPTYVRFSGVVLDVGRTGGGNQRAVVRGYVSAIGLYLSDGYDVGERNHTGEEFAGTGYSLDDGYKLSFVYLDDAISFRVMAYIRPHQPHVVLGQEVVLQGTLLPLRSAANPGGYNQFQHLRSQKVDASIWPSEIIRGEVQSTLVVSLRRFRDRLAGVYDYILPTREAGIIKSMVLGDRLELDRELAAQYRMMGIFHILSISGMHVTILTLAAFSVLKLFINQRRAGVIVLFVMILYCLMTGAAVPTVRAVTMGGVLVFGRVLHRDYDLLASVSFAGICLLIYEPLYLFNVGFQLSFCAVIGIGVLKSPIERGLALCRLPAGEFRGSLSVGIAAVVASYLVFAHHLYEIPLYSVIGNIVIMPTVTVLLVLGALVGLVGLVWMPGAEIMAGPVYFILRFYELASGFFASLPGAMALVGGGSLVVTGALVVVVLCFAYAFSGFGEDFNKRLVLFFSAVLVLTCCVFVRDFPLDLRVTVLQARGEYAVLRHRGEMLIIGNGRGGESVLLNYMDKRGLRRAHGLVLSQPPRPSDIRRLEDLLPRIEVLYLPGGFVTIDGLRDAAVAHGVELVRLHDGYAVALGGMELTVESRPGFGMELRVSFGDSVLGFVGDGGMLDAGAFVGVADVVIADSTVVLGQNMYCTEYHGAILLRVGRQRIRYWVMRE